MNQVTLTFIDTTGIQPYIFNSNRLRENIGASFLVEEFSRTWVEAELQSLSGKIPVPGIDIKTIESSAEVEVIYSAGGNSAILFKQQEQAIAFINRISLKLLKEAPGLNIIVAHSKPFNWDPNEKGKLKGILDDLIKTDVEAKKNERRPSVPLMGLGVTADCMSTRLPAIGMSDKDFEERSYRISREVHYKIAASKKANVRLKQVFSKIKNPNQISFDFPLRLDHLGRSHDESSYVAIVHADGNAMGDRFKRCGEGKSNREFITDLRLLSQKVQKASTEALCTVVERIVSSIAEGRLWLKDGNSIELKEEEGKVLLPFRPIVFGGDDTTFVCDGRLGILLASIYLEAFEQKMAVQGEGLTACAGVSIAKAHYPFARSYEMSEALCKSAKQLNHGREQPGSAIDWHISATGLLGSLKETRDREYTVKAGRLYMRPIWMTEVQHDWRNWQTFQKIVQAFIQGSDNNWKGNRNKVMALREELRQGRNEVENFLAIYRLGKLPQTFCKDSSLAECGWTADEGENVCGYFDAIEAMDFYVQLQPVEPSKQGGKQS